VAAGVADPDEPAMRMAAVGVGVPTVCYMYTQAPLCEILTACVCGVTYRGVSLSAMVTLRGYRILYYLQPNRLLTAALLCLCLQEVGIPYLQAQPEDIVCMLGSLSQRCGTVEQVRHTMGSVYAREKRKSDQTSLVAHTKHMGDYCRGLTAHSTLS
jgi:hypothetical protein